jgi:hypothetical protein
MAGSAIFAKLAFVHIILFVTRDAFGRDALQLASEVARFTVLDFRVLPRKLVAREAVIEATLKNSVPIGGMMTESAVRS